MNALSQPWWPSEPQPQGTFVNLMIAVCMLLFYSNALVIASRFHGLPSAIGYSLPLLLIAIGAWAILRQGHPVRLTSALPWLCLFLLAGSIGTMTARFPGLALLTLVEMVLEGVVLYLVVVNAVRSPRTLNFAVWAIIGAAAFMGAVVTHQLLTENYSSNYFGFGQVGDLLDQEEEDAGSRLAGAIGEVNRFAQVLAMALPLALVKVAVERGRLRWVAALAAAAMLAGCLATYSRGVIVGLIPVVIAAVLLGYVKLRHLALGGALLVAFVLSNADYRERVASLGKIAVSLVAADGIRNSDGAVRGRYASIAASGLVFLDNPVFGAGPGMNKYHYVDYARHVGGKVRYYPREAHSLVPQIAAEWGTVGLIGFLGAIGAVVLGLARKLRELRAAGDPNEHLPSALLLSLLAYGGTSVFLHLSYIRYFWLMLGLAAAAALLQASRSTSKSTAPSYIFSSTPQSSIARSPS